MFLTFTFVALVLLSPASMGKPESTSTCLREALEKFAVEGRDYGKVNTELEVARLSTDKMLNVLSQYPVEMRANIRANHIRHLATKVERDAETKYLFDLPDNTTIQMSLKQYHQLDPRVKKWIELTN